MHRRRRGGEIGRRSRLKICRWKHRAGSIPAPGTRRSQFATLPAGLETLFRFRAFLFPSFFNPVKTYRLPAGLSVYKSSDLQSVRTRDPSASISCVPHIHAHKKTGRYFPVFLFHSFERSLSGTTGTLELLLGSLAPCLQQRVSITRRLRQPPEHQIAGSAESRRMGKIVRHSAIGRISCILLIDHCRHSF